MGLVERVRQLELGYEPIPFDDYRTKISLLVPYFEEGIEEEILFELYRFEKFEKVYLHLLGYVQSREGNFPRMGIWDLGTNLLPHYAGNFAIPSGGYRDGFPGEIRKNFLDLLEHRLGPNGEKVEQVYVLGDLIPTPSHMSKIIDLIGESLALFKDYMDGLIENSPASLDN